MSDPGKYFHNNLALSLNLIEAYGPSRRRAVSCCPRRPLSTAPATIRSRKQSPIGPTNVYGETKWMIEQALEWYHRLHGLRFAALRYFNAAGAAGGRGEAHRPESHLIPLCCRCLRPSSVDLESSAMTTRPLTARASAITSTSPTWWRRTDWPLDALDDRPPPGLQPGQRIRLFRSGSHRRRSTGDRPRPFPPRSAPAAPEIRPVWSPHPPRSTRDLGWQPAYPKLEDILASAWEWHRDHPSGYPET